MQQLLLSQKLWFKYENTIRTVRHIKCGKIEKIPRDKTHFLPKHTYPNNAKI